jgi:hypothetical protein
MNREFCVNIPWSFRATPKLVPLNHMAESHNDFFVRELTDALSTLRTGTSTLPEAPKKKEIRVFTPPLWICWRQPGRSERIFLKYFQKKY